MLTKESTKILEFIDTKTNTNIGLKHDIRELFDFFDSIDYETKINSVQDISSSFQSITIDSPFISENIKKEIKEFNNIKKINFSTNKSTITLNIYYSNEDITKFLNTIVHVICFMFNISIHSVRSCTINFYLSNYTKYLDSNKNLMKMKLILVQHQVILLIYGEKKKY